METESGGALENWLFEFRQIFYYYYDLHNKRIDMIYK